MKLTKKYEIAVESQYAGIVAIDKYENTKAFDSFEDARAALTLFVLTFRKGDWEETVSLFFDMFHPYAKNDRQANRDITWLRPILEITTTYTMVTTTSLDIDELCKEPGQDNDPAFT